MTRRRRPRAETETPAEPSPPQVDTLWWTMSDQPDQRPVPLQRLPEHNILEALASLDGPALHRPADRPFMETMLRRELARRTRLREAFFLATLERQIRWSPDLTMTEAILADLGELVDRR